MNAQSLCFETREWKSFQFKNHFSRQRRGPRHVLHVALEQNGLGTVGERPLHHPGESFFKPKRLFL